MSESDSRRSYLAVILVGLVYCLVGIAFPAPADHLRAWRLAAWLVSVAVYAVHLGYEFFTLRTSPRSGALHVALAVALGALGLAVAANVHSWSVASTSQHRRLLLLALVIWPVMTAVPAFLAALAANIVLARLPLFARTKRSG